jgi:alkylation response protein AidB-like acyl-CoA dehydrogenase
MAPPAKSYSRDEVRSHTTDDSLWCIIDSTVYELTDFLDAHPGGESVLRQVAGQDATTVFYNLHRHEVLSKYADLVIGTVSGEKPQVITPAPGDLSPVPYAEPLWLTTPFRSPYYRESHHRLRRAAREFTQVYIAPEALECEATGRSISQELIDRMERVGILRMRLGPGKHLHGRELFGGVVSGEDFDYFHFVVLAQEICRPLARGFQDGNMAGMTIGLSAFLNFAPEGEWKDRVCEDVFSGKKKICLAISEAFAGSDVANIRTTAERTPDGKHFVSPPTKYTGRTGLLYYMTLIWRCAQIVNGTKKWITNGIDSDYFVTMVRTGKGFSVLLIPRCEGLETKPIKTSYSASAGTAFITYDNVKVPAENILGQENQGMRVILSNFNHERWGMVCTLSAPFHLHVRCQKHAC